ncbi:hypothetical protein DL93DRAFT_2089926 [Clavulina sp. PMI_390]|nr:hypothetical protein DL93DRAFT_2089926 [Clavulina sp. PMI_390]
MKDPTLFERQGRTFEKIVLFFHYAKALLTVPPQKNPPEDGASPELWERYDLLVEQYPALVQQYDEFSREFASLTLTHWSSPSAYQGRVWEFKKKYSLLEERVMAAVDVFFPSCSCGQTYSRFDSLRRHVKTATKEYSRPKDEHAVAHGWNRYCDDPVYAMKYLRFKIPSEEDLPV